MEEIGTSKWNENEMKMLKQADEAARAVKMEDDREKEKGQSSHLSHWSRSGPRRRQALHQAKKEAAASSAMAEKEKKAGEAARLQR